MPIGSSWGKGGKSSVDSKNIIPLWKNIRRDGVDEKCVKENIKYYKWTGTKGTGYHPSQVKMSTSMFDYIPPKHKPNSDCILCPKEKILETHLICSYTLNVFTLQNC